MLYYYNKTKDYKCFAAEEDFVGLVHKPVVLQSMRNKKLGLFLLILIFACADSFAADSTKAAAANRVGIAFSGDFTSDFKRFSKGAFGYRINGNYGHELNASWVVGIGLAYSQVGLKYEYAYYNHEVESSPSYTYVELPAFIQLNTGKSEKMRFIIRYSIGLYFFTEIFLHRG
jgi:hypothetical protein